MVYAYKVTGSIVLFKNNYTVKKAINSFLSSTLLIKLYLIDNSPTDILKTELIEFSNDERVEYIFNNKNIGFGAGHNVAVKKAMNISEYHLVLNPDVYFNEGVVEQLYNYASANPSVGQLIPKVLYPHGKLQYVCKLLPTPLNLFSRLLPKQLFKKYNQRFELRFSGYNKVMEAPYLHGCFMFLRCSALKEIGLFDERFFMYPEDIDLTRRMYKKYKTIYYPYVHIFHEHAKASFKNPRLFIIHLVNIAKYFNKWGWFFDADRKKINQQILQQFHQQL